MAFEVGALERQDHATAVADLAALLLDAVADGVSAGFLADLTLAEAAEWWRTALADPGHVTWVARDDDGRIVGVVQLRPAQEATGRHRAEVTKLLVHTQARGRGLGQRLMAALERAAAGRGRWLLVLDTQSGSPAERRYERWGWSRIGVLADHAAAPDGTLTPTTFFAKALPRVGEVGPPFTPPAIPPAEAAGRG